MDNRQCGVRQRWHEVWLLEQATVIQKREANAIGSSLQTVGLVAVVRKYRLSQ
jgi:hypothetical protein